MSTAPSPSTSSAREPSSGGELTPPLTPRKRRDSYPPAEQTGRWTWIGRIAIGLILGLALGYLGGRIHGAVATTEVEHQMRDAELAHQNELRGVRADHQREVASKDVQYAELEGVLADARATITDQHTLIATEEVYRTLIHAVLALDARNFGIAESHVRQAERLLGPLATASAAHAALLTDLRQVEIVVAGNLSRQRARVSSFVPRLDSIIDELEATLPPEPVPGEEADHGGDEFVPTGLEEGEPAEPLDDSAPAAAGMPTGPPEPAASHHPTAPASTSPGSPSMENLPSPVGESADSETIPAAGASPAAKVDQHEDENRG